MPDASTLAALTSIPAAVAVIATAGLFLKHIADQRDKDRTDRAAERAADRVIWENHLSKITPVLQSLVGEVKELRQDVRAQQ